MADVPAASDKKPDAKSDDKEGLHKRALEQFDTDYAADQDNRDEALKDLEFRAGEQWDAKTKKERETDGRPTLTIDRVSQFVRMVIGDIRQNKPAIKVRPVEDADVGLAEIYTGLTRHIEQTSRADTAYINAVDGAASCGMGHIRVNTEYTDPMSFNQDIRIERIQNPFAVLWDHTAKRLDKSDAGHCFVIDRMSKKDFEAKYPKASTSDFGRTGVVGADVNWFTDDDVRICEYWVKKVEKINIGLYADGSSLPLDSEEAKMRPDKPLREKEAEKAVVCQYIMSGAEILEGPNEWAGKYIPFATVTGEEIAVGEKIVRRGIIRPAKDAQRLFNYARSSSAEAMAQAPKSPWLVTIDMLKGVKTLWENAGRKNYPFLPYTPDPKAPGGKPERTQPAAPAVGMMEESNLAADDMKAVTGIYDAALGARSNETSGRAIMAREAQGDTGTFIYTDNLSVAIEQVGRIIVDLIPHIYDTERVIRTLGEDGTEAAYIINKMMAQDDGSGGMTHVKVAMPVENKPNAKPIFMSDDAKYDVVVTTGPSYATKRMESQDAFTQLMQALPQQAPLIADLVVKNMDVPGAEQIAKRLKKQLPPGIDDEGPAQPPPPDPEKETKAAKTAAEAEGVQLDNAKKELELSMMLPIIQQAVSAGIAQMFGMQAPQGAPMNPDAIMPPPDTGDPNAPPDASQGVPQQPAQDAGFSMPEQQQGGF